MSSWPPSRRPLLAKGVRLAWDRPRSRWVLLAPERVVVADDHAAAVLRLVDGERSLAEIARQLERDYEAPAAVIEADVAALLNELSAAGLVR